MKHLAVILTTCMIVLTSFVHVSNEENNTVSPRVIGDIPWEVDPMTKTIRKGLSFYITVTIYKHIGLFSERNLTISTGSPNDTSPVFDVEFEEEVGTSPITKQMHFTALEVGTHNITIRINGSYTENGITKEYDQYKTVVVTVVD